METELSCSQTDIELWVPPFLSYELWKLRIELRKQAIQIAFKHLYDIYSIGLLAFLLTPDIFLVLSVG